MEKNRNYFSIVLPTYIENWNPDLYKLSIPQIDITLNLEEAINLNRCQQQDGIQPLDYSNDSFSHLFQKIDKALQVFPEGAFIRLGSRSAKDSYYALNKGLRVNDAHSAMRMLTETSARMAFDLKLALRNNYLPHVFVRKWLDIPDWSEFRCFMKNKELVGISQYDCKNVGSSTNIARHQQQIKTSIETFFKQFCLLSHMDTVVFDVFVEVEENIDETLINVTLLELNPFFKNTDYCLFHKADFDGSFRFL